MSKEEGYRKRLKNFLDSDTPNAKIANIALCVFAFASIPVLVIGAGAMGNAIQVFGMFKGSKKYSKKQIQSAVDSIKKQRLIEYVCDKDGKTVVKITKKGETRLRTFDVDLIEIKKPMGWKVATGNV